MPEYFGVNREVLLNLYVKLFYLQYKFKTLTVVPKLASRITKNSLCSFVSYPKNLDSCLCFASS